MSKQTWRFTLPAIAAAAHLGFIPPAFATTYTWADWAVGNWSDAALWSPGGGPPNAAGDVARYTNATTATAVTTVDMDATVGKLWLEPPVNTIDAPSWTIENAATPPTLTLDAVSDSAEIAIGRCSGTLTVKPNLVLQDPLVLRTFGVNNGKVAVQGAIGGTGNLSIMNEATGGSASITLSGPLNFAGAIDVNGPRNTTISGSIGSGVASITKNSAGQLTFGNIILSTPSFLAINGGTVAFNNSSGRIRNLPVAIAAGATLYGGNDLGIIFDDGTVDLAVNGELKIEKNGSSTSTIRNLSGSSTGLITLGRRVDSQNVLIVTQTIDDEFAGVLRNNLINAGRAALIKKGAATLTLSGNNSHGGTTTVDAGTLKLGHDNALGYGGYYASANAVQGTAVNAGGTVDLNGRTVNEPFALAGGALVNGNLSQTAMIDNGVAGVQVTAEPSNTSATIAISGGGGSGATATAAFPSGGAGVRGVRMTNPGSGYTSVPTVTISSGGGTPTAVLSRIILTGTSGSLGGLGNLTVRAAIGETASGAGFTKTGAGTLWLNGVNTYTGPTVVSQGALGGTGTIAGDLTVAEGTAIVVDLAQGDGLTVAGTVDLTAGGATLVLSGTTEAEEIVLLSAGTLRGTFAAVTGVPDGYAVSAATANQVWLRRIQGTEVAPI